ncbi:MAG: PIN domain-containing protein [Blastocatellia bacterium]|nr:PIN domain-containing protein [Blastocatellia bacterium]
MDVYLLDTNAASAFWDGYNPYHQDMVDFIQDIGGEHYVYVSRVVVAEIEYGHKVYLSADSNRREVIEKAMKVFKIREIGRHTTAPYSDIRAALFKRFGRVDSKGKLKKQWPEDLVDRTTSKELGIQENDLWMAAIAVEYNMVLVTEDKMTRIKEVEPRLRCAAWRKRT